MLITFLPSKTDTTSPDSAHSYASIKLDLHQSKAVHQIREKKIYLQ